LKSAPKPRYRPVNHHLNPAPDEQLPKTPTARVSNAYGMNSSAANIGRTVRCLRAESSRSKKAERARHGLVGAARHRPPPRRISPRRRYRQVRVCHQSARPIWQELRNHLGAQDKIMN